MTVCLIQHTQSFSGVFVTSCVLKSHPPLRVPHMGRCLGSCIICWRSRPACVLINVCQFICTWVCTCVQKGGTGSGGNRDCLFPRWGQRTDVIHFRSVGLLLLTHTHKMLLLPQQQRQHPQLQLLIFTGKKHHLFCLKMLPMYCEVASIGGWHHWWVMIKGCFS